MAPPRRAFVEQVMGLPVSVHIRGEAARSPHVEAAVARMFADLHADDARFSTYRPTSEVMRYRRGEVETPSADLAEVIARCAAARELTRGAFDADLPGGFDPSGLVKGWAVERAARHLPEVTAGSDWLVNAGGDILAHAEDGRIWTVGIEDPAAPSRILRALALADGGVATSGTTHRGAHLVDPRTGRPATSALRSATVIAPTLVHADVLATAAYVWGDEALGRLAAMPGIGVLLVRADGSIVSAAAPTALPLAVTEQVGEHLLVLG